MRNHYSVYYRTGIIIEDFDHPQSDAEARKYVQKRYSDSDSLTVFNHTTGSIVFQGDWTVVLTK